MNIKEMAHELIDNLPDAATWEEISYQLELRASIERGLADSDAGRIVSLEVLMEEFGLDE